MFTAHHQFEPLLELGALVKHVFWMLLYSLGDLIQVLSLAFHDLDVVFDFTSVDTEQTRPIGKKVQVILVVCLAFLLQLDHQHLPDIFFVFYIEGRKWIELMAYTLFLGAAGVMKVNLRLSSDLIVVIV